MDRWLTDLIDRYFVSEPTTDSVRAIILLAELVQAASVADRFRYPMALRTGTAPRPLHPVHPSE